MDDTCDIAPPARSDRHRDGHVLDVRSRRDLEPVVCHVGEHHRSEGPEGLPALHHTIHPVPDLCGVWRSKDASRAERPGAKLHRATRPADHRIPSQELGDHLHQRTLIEDGIWIGAMRPRGIGPEQRQRWPDREAVLT
jgi:hypothetical protein